MKKPEKAEPESALETYLQDHLAGATAGLALAESLRDSNADHEELGEPLAALAAEVAEDKARLEELMQTLEVPSSRLKNSVARIGELLRPLKPDGSMIGAYSYTTLLLELEAMFLGVTGKLSLWENLEAAFPEQRSGELGIPDLRRRAERQRESLIEMRRYVAGVALASR